MRTHRWVPQVTRSPMWPGALVATLVLLGCGGGGGGTGGGSGGGGFGGGLGGGSGGGAGGGSGGGGGGTASGAFLVDRASETATPQLARDGAGVLHLLASPMTKDAQNHAYVRYGRCASACDVAANWSYAPLADGPLSSDVKLAVEPGGTVHVAFFTPQQVSFGRCASNCTTAASWTFANVTPPMGQTWRSLPRGRAFGVSASGHERLVLNGYATAGLELILLGNDGGGWTADPIVDFEVNAVSLVTSGEGAQLVAGPANAPFNLAYAECTSSCGGYANWSRAAVLAGNPYALGLDRGPSGELHLAYTASQGAADHLVYARCAAQCLTPSSWTAIELGDGNDGRGGLDVSVRSNGAVAIAGATAAGMAQTLNLRRCAGNCTQAASWAGGQIEAGAAVSEAHPTFNGSACNEASTLRYWTVGETVQLVPSATGWQLAYDATSYARCLAGTNTTGYVSGIWVRLQQRPAP